MFKTEEKDAMEACLLMHENTSYVEKGAHVSISLTSMEKGPLWEKAPFKRLLFTLG